MNEAQRLTFFEKKQTVCPVCNGKFYREELLSGGGRLIAGELAPDLRRYYEPSKKYGEVNPLIYPISVCPVCFFAAFPQDFAKLPDKERKTAEIAADERHENARLLFSDLDFTSPRTLMEGLASYFLAISCYEFFDKHANPTFKAGLSSLRAAWCAEDLHEKFPGDNWDYVAKLFFRKARFYYSQSLEMESKGQEPFEQTLQFGPDIDKNYGYHGVIYLAAYLGWKHGTENPAEKRVEELVDARRLMAKVFGIGKSSKNKPSVLLDKAKDIYENIGEEIKRLQPDAAEA